MDGFRLSAAKTYTAEPDTAAFRMHTHDSYEIYCFLAGDAKYFVEGSIYELKPGDILIIKKAEAHSLLINTVSPYERIVVNFDPEALLEDDPAAALEFIDRKPLGQDNRYAFSLGREKPWLVYLENMCAAEDAAERRLYLTVLLRELRKCSPSPNADTVQDNLADVLTYINSHLTSPLSLDGLCSRFFFSKSRLNRSFKRITGSTVWEYITAKRLLLAKELLQKGVPPTAVYLQCGFGDYSVFFRAYKQHFHRSPREDHRKDKTSG